jgi:hypothetical protein
MCRTKPPAASPLITSWCAPGACAAAVRHVRCLILLGGSTTHRRASLLRCITRPRRLCLCGSAWRGGAPWCGGGLSRAAGSSRQREQRRYRARSGALAPNVANLGRPRRWGGIVAVAYFAGRGWHPGPISRRVVRMRGRLSLQFRI